MMDDKLNYFTDYTNKQFVLYSKNGAIYKPSCDKVFKIANIAKSNSCYYDTPIIAFYKSRQISAFLTSNGIIRDSSTVVPCTNQFRYNKIRNSTYTIVSMRNEYRINENLKYKKLNPLTQFFDVRFDHDKALVHGVNYMEQMTDLYKVSQSNRSWFVINKEFESSLKFKEPIIELKLQIEKFIKKSSFYITIIIITILVIWLAVCSLKYVYNTRRPIYRSTATLRKHDDTVRLVFDGDMSPSAPAIEEPLELKVINKISMLKENNNLIIKDENHTSLDSITKAILNKSKI